MLTLLPTLSIHVSSISSSSVSSIPTLRSHFLFPFSHSPKIELRLSVSQVGFRPTEHLFLQCRCIPSPASPDGCLGMLISFLGEVGLDEEEIEILLHKNPNLIASSFDSIRARTLSLQSAGVSRLMLCRLITKRPDVLTADGIDTLLRFISDDLAAKIEPLQLERLLTATDPQFLVGFDQKVGLLLHHGVPQEKIVHVLNNVNLTKALCLRSIEEINRAITYLKPFGGVDIILKRPGILNYDLDTQLIPRVELFKELSGGDEDATGSLLLKLPAILTYSREHVENHIEFLRSFAGLTDEQIFRVVLVFPNVISASKDRKLYPRIQFLKQCGLDSSAIFKFLTKAPLFLGLSFQDNLTHKLGFLAKIGYKYRTKDMAVAIGAVTRTSCENMQMVIGLFLEYGFSYADIFAMSKKHPQILQYSHSSLEKKMDYLTVEMGRDIDELLYFPAFLGYKLDDRIKHRYEVKKKIIGEGMSINKLLSVSTERFSKNRKNISLHDLQPQEQ